MDKDHFLNSGIPPPSLQFEQTLPTWNSLSSEQSTDCFMNPNWDHHHPHTSTDQFNNPFDSALTSIAVSTCSPGNHTLALRELIGKLGNVSNSNDITPLFPAMTTAATPPCFTARMSSPHNKSGALMADQILNSNSTQNSSLHPLSSDPGFAERAAKFSSFGSRSINGRTSQLGCKIGEFLYRSEAALGTLPRVGSSPAINQDRSPVENKNSGFEKSLNRLSGSGANSNEESSVSEQVTSVEAGSKAAPGEPDSRKRKTISRGKAKEVAPNQAPEALKVDEADEDANVKRSKPTIEGNGSENSGEKNEEAEKSNANATGDECQKTSEPPKDYIHVRARRGQATDSHSLAERVRREKISERMKLLQDLVPGCNKVTGKALMLDEIINYVQALQRQVEFLSMKLASVNPRTDCDVNNLMSKDMFQPNASLTQPTYPYDSSTVAIYGHQPQQSPQLHTNNASTGSASQCRVDPLDTTLCHNLGMQLPPLNGFGEGLSQFAALCEDDLQSIVQMGFNQNPNRDVPYHSQGFPEQSSRMKVEL